jgi:hypothetical protein
MKTIASIALACAGVSAMAQSAPPRDVPADHWARPAVENLYRLGILQGYPDGTFKGTRPVSRFELSSAVNAMYVSIRNITDGIERGFQGLPKVPDYASAADLAEFRRDLDALRVDVAGLRATRTEVDGLNRDFADLNEQLRRIRADLESMRGTLDRTKTKQ